MYARATSMGGDPARVDEAGTLLEEELYPQMQQLDGFRGVLALGDRADGSSLVITLWDSEEAMKASEERANQMRGTAANRTGAAAAPQVDRYEVLFYKTL